jgi:hypothetical protein
MIEDEFTHWDMDQIRERWDVDVRAWLIEMLRNLGTAVQVHACCGSSSYSPQLPRLLRDHVRKFLRPEQLSPVKASHAT